MVQSEHTFEGEDRYSRFFEWVDRKLYPVIGAPPLGPYGDVEEVLVAECPVCHHPLTEHTIDHSTSNAILHCPVEAEPPPMDVSPLNEFGMPTDKARARAERHESRSR